MPRSTCAINLSLEIIGDRWTLLILRDMILDNRRHFGGLLVSEERIASNVLADRLKMLVAEGLLTRSEDLTHKQRAIYSLTEKSISLLPVVAQIALWGQANLPDSELNARGQALMGGGPRVWARYMAELRETHLGVVNPHVKRGRVTGGATAAAARRARPSARAESAKAATA
jgi:DNA-binding HxlR family transcriptional regulator